jgi:hypothetical protein
MPQNVSPAAAEAQLALFDVARVSRGCAAR